jgi:hypothetical protein
MLEFDSFYNGFMAPYFACYRCSDTKKAIQALDMDKDGSIHWNEFMIKFLILCKNFVTHCWYQAFAERNV